MAKKIIIGIIVVVVILIILSIGWYYWQNNNGNQGIDDLSNRSVTNSNFNIYENYKFDYSIDYPKDWFLGFYGESEEQAQVVFFVSDQKDLQGADGGPPLGAKVEIIVQNLKELKDMDESMSHIDIIDEYVQWQKTYQASFDTEMKGVCIEQKVTIGSLDGIMETCDNPESGFGKSKKVQFLSPDGNTVFLIQYLGSEPHYSNNAKYFEDLYKSLRLY